MKSVIINDPFDVESIDEDIPVAGPGEIVVEAELSGISSSNSQRCRLRWPPISPIR